MKIDLSVKERVVLLDFVPKEGNVLILKMVQDLMESLSFSDEESKKLCFHQTLQGQVLWDEDVAKNISKQIEIPDTIKDQISSKLIKLNDKNKLTLDHLCIYDKFIEAKN